MLARMLSLDEVVAVVQPLTLHLMADVLVANLVEVGQHCLEVPMVRQVRLQLILVSQKIQ